MRTISTESMPKSSWMNIQNFISFISDHRHWCQLLLFTISFIASPLSTNIPCKQPCVFFKNQLRFSHSCRSNDDFFNLPVLCSPLVSRSRLVEHVSCVGVSFSCRSNQNLDGLLDVEIVTFLHQTVLLCARLHHGRHDDGLLDVDVERLLVDVEIVNCTSYWNCFTFLVPILFKNIPRFLSFFCAGFKMVCDILLGVFWNSFCCVLRFYHLLLPVEIGFR